MKDLTLYINECKEAVESLGIKLGNISDFTINTRAKSRLGSCKKIGADTFEISISEFLLDDKINSQILKNTIMHELLHTVKGCFSHKGKWKLLSQAITEKFPDYCIKRTTDLNKIGIESNFKEPSFKYILRCVNCGCVIKRQRLSKAVKNYHTYRCGKCGGKLIRIK